VGAAPAEAEDADLALAMRLSLLEASGTGGASTDGVSADTDLALALALAEQEAQAAAARTRRGACAAQRVAPPRSRPPRILLARRFAPSRHAGGHEKVTVVPIARKWAEEAAALRGKPARVLLSADDADVAARLDAEAEAQERALASAPLAGSDAGRDESGGIAGGDESEESEEREERLASSGRAADGSLLTKHDTAAAARKLARQVEREMGAAAGDLRDASLPSSAIVDLRRFMQKQSVKGGSAHGEFPGLSMRGPRWLAPRGRIPPPLPRVCGPSSSHHPVIALRTAHLPRHPATSLACTSQAAWRRRRTRRRRSCWMRAPA